MSVLTGDDEAVIPDCFDEFQTNSFLQDDFDPRNNDLDDCHLSKDALDEFLAPSQETWKDFLPTTNEAVITIDGSNMKQWDLAKKEIEHVRDWANRNEGR